MKKIEMYSFITAALLCLVLTVVADGVWARAMLGFLTASSALAAYMAAKEGGFL